MSLVRPPHSKPKQQMLEGCVGDLATPDYFYHFAQLLEESSSYQVQLLGGRVDELYEAWEFQNKFGGSARPAAAADPAAELDRPPRFQTFVPGKTRVPKRPPAQPGANGHR